MGKYNWKGINYPSAKDDQKKFEKNNPKSALNLSYTKRNKKIYPAYISKYN